MKKVSKLFLFLLLSSLLLLLHSSTFCSAENQAATSIIKIGVLIPLSGEWAFLGEGIKDAALLAQEDLDKHDKKIQLFFEDNKGSQKDSALLAQKLIHTNKVQTLISIFSGIAQTLKPIAEANKVINIGICSDQTVDDGKYSLIYYITAEQGAKRFVDYLTLTAPTLNTPINNIGIFSQNEDGFLRISNEIEKLSKNLQFKIAFNETFNAGTTDFRSLILRRINSMPELLVLLSLSPDVEILAKQLRESGYKGKFTSIEAFSLTKDKTPFEGSWYVDAPTDASFMKSYVNKYGSDPQLGSAQAYSITMKLADAAGSRESGDIPNIDEIVNKLRGVRNNDLKSHSNINETTADSLLVEPVIKVIKNGKSINLED